MTNDIRFVRKGKEDEFSYLNKKFKGGKNELLGYGEIFGLRRFVREILFRKNNLSKSLISVRKF